MFLQKQQELQKANQKQYAEGKMWGAASKEDCWAAAEKRWSEKQKRTNRRHLENGDGGSTGETPQPLQEKGLRVDPTVKNQKTLISRAGVKDSSRTETMACWWLGLNYPAKTALLSSCQEECGFHFRGLVNYKKSRGNTDQIIRSMQSMRLWLGKRSTSMWCWALNCSTNLRGRSTLRSLRTTLMHPGCGVPRLLERLQELEQCWPIHLWMKRALPYYWIIHSFLKYLAKNSAILFSASHGRALWVPSKAVVRHQHPPTFDLYEHLFVSQSFFCTKMYFGNVHA